MSNLLEVRGVNFAYPSLKVLTDINLTIREGESHVIIGPNGAGKTTLFKVLSGEMFAKSGQVFYEGQDVSALDAWQRVHRGIGRTFQMARLFVEQTVLDNVIMALESRERIKKTAHGRWWRLSPTKEIVEEAHLRLAEYGLLKRVDDLAANLSHGDKKRLELLLTLALRPKLIMLDEPTAGMAPEDRRAAIETINRLRQSEGLTLLLTEHDMEVVFGLATRLTVLNHGEIIASGDPEEVRRDPTVRSIYFGKGAAHA
ncbi:branched-chain amino acid transport system ATP-binding protein [Rhizobium petrolearium]|jgi:branched-chain amino acid transport system ATP-binding protein|uniref:ABC transporter ATP-binding protein n=2 Tax=Neorhizobium TaxID=1525371 RepID=A0ABV0MA31_9HYPH|nr:ABC transporter ATP-binding protein [Neorhizobium petrolearium]MBP1847271.1 branched-chain amino acid transport system ATP-binding protein [Neorhizobium petrolearium]MCC2614313.1 ABC transporter ATP-binding protein [Neorhizobium petrolearium]WGI72416.1 ABC transporter ATP-binding protein [Neorhizobium petrolearium]